jgi:hypothetical protein
LANLHPCVRWNAQFASRPSLRPARTRPSGLALEAHALALLSAASYGVSDYLAGVISRSWDRRLVTAAAQLIGLLTAALAVLLFPGGTFNERGQAYQPFTPSLVLYARSTAITR